MATLVQYFIGTEAQILALTPVDENWVERAFYYPTDKTYFYMALGGEMKKYGYYEPSEINVSGVGIMLNDKVIGGVKSLIEINDILFIPENFEYNLLNLQIEGVINNEGVINILN